MLMQNNISVQIKRELTAFGDTVASGGTSIMICRALIPAGNSGGHSSAPLPLVDFQTFLKIPPVHGCFDLAA